MKLLFFIPSLYNSGGMERISTDLVNLLARRGHACGFVLLKSDTTSFFPVDPSVSIHSLGADGGVRQNRWSVARRLREYLRRERPDVLINVDVSMVQIAALAFPATLGVKMLGWDQFSMANESKLLQRFKRYFTACVCRRLIVLTEADRGCYRFFRHKVVTIGNFTTINPSGQVVDGASHQVLSVGRLCDVKGFDLLLNAWQKVESEVSDWTLKIVGGGGIRPSLEEQLRQLNLQRAEILPPTQTIATQYLQSALYILPSRFEPFGLVLIEAKSFGLPVISFDCPYGPAEIVRPGVDGELVPNGDTAALAEAIVRTIRDADRRRQYGREARQDYLSRWSCDCVADKWEAVFRS